MRLTRVVLCMMALTMLAGCSKARQELGFSRHSPDEFTVVKRAPLTLPPNYNLRPPGSGAPTVQVEATEKARSVVFGETEEKTPVADPSLPKGEQVLLSEAGVDAANPEIRDILDKEAGYVVFGEKTVADKVIFWKDLGSQTEEVLVDPGAEAERLKQNETEGKPVTEGDTPVIIEKRKKIDLF